MLYLKAKVYYVNNQKMLWDFPNYTRSQGSLALVKDRYDGFRGFSSKSNLLEDYSSFS